LAIDFGAKRWQTRTLDIHLRLAKLRISRKILFAGPLATILMISNEATKGLKQKDLLEYLKKNFGKPPLCQLACHLPIMTDESKASLKRILVGYDKFIETLTKYSRKELVATYSGPAENNPKEIWNSIGSSIQEGLESIFFKDPLFSKTTQKFGLF
jgi:hypothetical protein